MNKVVDLAEAVASIPPGSHVALSVSQRQDV